MKTQGTRKHSSRMRTTHLWPPRYVSTGGGRGGGWGVRYTSRIFTPRYISTRYTYSPGYLPPQMNRQTPVKNIAFPQLLLRAVKITKQVQNPGPVAVKKQANVLQQLQTFKSRCVSTLTRSFTAGEDRLIRISE